jgi:hypothetical protein
MGNAIHGSPANDAMLSESEHPIVLVSCTYRKQSTDPMPTRPQVTWNCSHRVGKWNPWSALLPQHIRSGGNSGGGNRWDQQKVTLAERVLEIVEHETTHSLGLFDDSAMNQCVGTDDAEQQPAQRMTRKSLATTQMSPA